jgi:RNA polymerase sigma factor (sigma-70 family)
MEAPQTTRQVVETVLLDPHERQKLIGFACSRFGILPEDAEDLLQETALELLRQRHYVHSPRGYLFTVFKKRCVRLLRLRRLEGNWGPLPDGAACPSSDPLGETRDRGIAIRQALCRISSACRRLLAAHYIEGKSLRETAAHMARAASGMGNTIDRCLKRLRACMI